MPVESKVVAATVASTLSGLVVMLIGTLLFHGASVPAAVASFVGAVVVGVVTYAAGWMARHTPRPRVITVDTGSSAPPTATPAPFSSVTPLTETAPAAPPATLPTTPPSTPGGP